MGYKQDGLSMHKTMQGRWVFYERLKSDNNHKYEKLYLNAKTNLLEYADIGQRKTSAQNNIRRIAEAERKKEIALLQEIFGSQVVFDLNSPTIAKDLTVCFNSFLNIRSVFERNLDLLTNSNGQKTVMSFFPFYFNKVFDTYRTEITKALQKGGKNASLEIYLNNIDNVFDNYIPQIVSDTLMVMSGQTVRGIQGAKAESGTKGVSSHDNAYREFAEALAKLPANNRYVKQIMDIYGLTGIKEELKKERSNRTFTGKEMKKKVKIDTSIFHSKAGNFVEVVREAMVNLCVDGLKDISINGKSIQVEVQAKANAVRMGELNMRDDLIVSVGLPDNFIEDYLSKNVPLSASKSDSIQYMKQLNQELQQYKDSFIIHTSSKNYTTNDDFMKRGGYGTIGLNLRQMEEVLQESGLRSRNIITAILQLGEGAIGHGEKIKKNLEDALSEYFGQIMFDDVATIGSSMAKANNKSIHVLDLNQTEVPLSVFLYALADAFDTGSNRDFVSIRITPKPILWDAQEKQNKAFPNNSGAAWVYQRESALDTTKITTHFFKNIREFMKNFS